MQITICAFKSLFYPKLKHNEKRTFKKLTAALAASVNYINSVV